MSLRHGKHGWCFIAKSCRTKTKMPIKRGLKDLLIADPDIANAVGDRVKIGRALKETDYPFYVFHGISAERVSGLQGVNACQKILLQVDCWASTPKDADILSMALHNVLDGWRGTLSEGSTVMACLPVGSVDLDDEEMKKSGTA